MSDYTDARSQPGARLNTGTDDRELFVTEFTGDVLQAWEETADYLNLTFQRSIKQGKADTFPIIGRKRDAEDHTPGEIVLGGKVEHNEVEISLDNMLVDAVFIAEIDELMAHYSLSGPYARQLGESLGTTFSRRIAIMHILASRVTTAPYTGGPLPGYSWHANMASDPAELEKAAFNGVQHIKENDIGGGPISYRLPWAQYLLLSRYTGIDSEATSGAGDRSKASVGLVAGIAIDGTNHIPNTNITTGPSKFRGDFTTTIGHIGNEMAVGTLNRRGLKVVMKQQDERLGTLLIASKFSGHGILRPETSYEVASATR